jgi:hypothetical protein
MAFDAKWLHIAAAITMASMTVAETPRLSLWASRGLRRTSRAEALTLNACYSAVQAYRVGLRVGHPTTAECRSRLQ